MIIDNDWRVTGLRYEFGCKGDVLCVIRRNLEVDVPWMDKAARGNDAHGARARDGLRGQVFARAAQHETRVSEGLCKRGSREDEDRRTEWQSGKS